MGQHPSSEGGDSDSKTSHDSDDPRKESPQLSAAGIQSQPSGVGIPTNYQNIREWLTLYRLSIIAV